MPQVVVNKQKWKEAIEGLELSRRLAKQVLSQLSYTPARLTFYLRILFGMGHLLSSPGIGKVRRSFPADLLSVSPQRRKEFWLPG